MNLVISRRPTRVVAALLVLSGLAALPAPAAGEDVSALVADDCTYPLGRAAESGPFGTLSAGSDPEWAIIDGTFRDVRKTQQSVVSLWGTLHLVVDGRWRIGDGGSRHHIVYRPFSDLGWQSPIEYPSNPNVSDAQPPGSALEPRAVAHLDRLWVVWEAQSNPYFETPGSAIVLRSRGADGTWADWIEVTPPEWTTVNRQPSLLSYGDKLLIAWLSMEGASQSLDFGLKGRFLEGGSLGPVFNISRVGDGFADLAFELETDGTRVAAAYISYNVSELVPNHLPRFAVFDGASWSEEVDLWPGTHGQSYAAAPAFYGGALYIAWDSNDTQMSRQGDYDVFMRVADPSTLALGPLVPLTTEDNQAPDYNPVLAVFGGRLHVNWLSSENGLTVGSDISIVLTSFDGSSWTAPRDVLADEVWPNNASRARFVAHGDALHLQWIEFVVSPGGPARDQRTATRLLERGDRWWDGLHATYRLDGDPPDGANATATVRVLDRSGLPVVSPWFSARSPDGSWTRLNGTGGTYALSFVMNRTSLDPFTVLVCGKPLPLEELAPPPPPSRPTPGAPAAAPLVALGAVGVAMALRPRRGPETGEADGERRAGP